MFLYMILEIVRPEVFQDTKKKFLFLKRGILYYDFVDCSIQMSI